MLLSDVTCARSLAFITTKTWKQLNRERIRVASCTIERLISQMSLRGAVRGKAFKTTQTDQNAQRAGELVESKCVASRPNLLWEADFTVVAT
jgi:hypothetical protein